MRDNKTYIIFSGERSGVSREVNALFTSEVEGYLKSRGIGFKRLEGRYKGVNETSFIAVYEPRLEDLAASYNQESVLLLAPDNTATLKYLNTDATLKLGRLTAITESEAKTLDAYSFRPDTNQYYTVK